MTPPTALARNVAGHLARGIALAWLLPLLMLPAATRAYGDGQPEPASIEERIRKVASDPRDQLFSLGGSDREWSVSNSKLGCLLLSPARVHGMRTAIGRHATYGRGLFLIGFSLAVSLDSPGEPVVVTAGGRNLMANGRVVARDVFFVALTRSDTAAALRELSSAGTLWVTLRQTALTEGGDAVKQAVEEYGRECGANDPAP